MISVGRSAAGGLGERAAAGAAETGSRAEPGVLGFGWDAGVGSAGAAEGKAGVELVRAGAGCATAGGPAAPGGVAALGSGAVGIGGATGVGCVAAAGCVAAPAIGRSAWRPIDIPQLGQKLSSLLWIAAHRGHAVIPASRRTVIGRRSPSAASIVRSSASI